MDGDAVMTVGSRGGAPVILASNQLGPSGVAVDARNVYWVTTDGCLRKMPIGGGTAITLSSSSWDTPSAVAVDTKHVYWGDFNGNHVRKIPIDGGSATDLVADDEPPVAIAIDATSVYWVTWADAGAVMKLSPK
jgi:hypothetical protein